VLWIGYLQWHFRMYGKTMPVPSPSCTTTRTSSAATPFSPTTASPSWCATKRQAVTRWDGESMKTSSTTGEEIPDESKRVEVYKYKNPRKAEWPETDFIVGNPPFVGKNRIRITLGMHTSMPFDKPILMSQKRPTRVLLVERGREHVAAGRCARFGLITTNSITQTFNRRVIETANTRESRWFLPFQIIHGWIPPAGPPFALQ